MEYIENKITWDQVFHSELEALQQKMSSFDIESLSKSKLRLSIENKILDWKKYESWAIETYGCASLKETTPDSVLKGFSVGAQQAYDLYSMHSFWNQDLIPIGIWENQVIVLGLQYSTNLQKIPNHIFILAHPKSLNFFANLLIANKPAMTDLNDLSQMFGEPGESIEGFEQPSQPLDFDFKNLSSETVTNFAARPRKNSIHNKNNESLIWDLISERHEEYVFESRKQFSAFLTLRLKLDLTNIFKMDPDLESRNLNEKLFEYNIKQNNAFKQVHSSGTSQILNASQLGLDLIGYEYVCITGIKRSQNVVGFFVGFKNEKPTEKDIQLLEDLAKESVEQAAAG